MNLTTQFDILFGIVVLQLDQCLTTRPRGFTLPGRYQIFQITCEFCQRRELTKNSLLDRTLHPLPLWTLHGLPPQTRFHATSALTHTLAFHQTRSVFIRNVMAPMVRALALATYYPARCTNIRFQRKSFLKSQGHRFGSLSLSNSKTSSSSSFLGPPSYRSSWLYLNTRKTRRLSVPSWSLQ